MYPPPKVIWPPKGKGIRCGTCEHFTATDIEDLGRCSLLSSDAQVHTQACCNFYHNSSDIVNARVPVFPASREVVMPQTRGKIKLFRD
jgi:hypothetical protein